MKQEVSKGAFIAIIAVVAVIAAVVIWKGFKGGSGPGDYNAANQTSSQQMAERMKGMSSGSASMAGGGAPPPTGGGSMGQRPGSMGSMGGTR
jgi:hypothetical protein